MTNTAPLALTDDPNIRKILIIKWGALGDLVIASAAFADLHAAFPHAQLHLNTLPPWVPLFAQDTRFEKIISLDIRGELAGLRGFYRWVTTIARERYDLIIDLQSNDRSLALLSLLCCCTRQRGTHRVAVERNHFPYTLSSTVSPTPVHALVRLQHAIELLGVRAQHPLPQLNVPHVFDAQLALIKQAQLTQHQYVVLFPGSSATGHRKRWGAHNYTELAQQLHARHHLGVVLLGSADDSAECEAIARACGDWLVNLCGKTQLLDIAPICAGAQAIIGNDNGGVHLAALTQRPIITLNGPTNPRVVQPLGKRVTALHAGVNCDCSRTQCVQHRCMRAITPTMLVHTFQQLVAAQDGSTGKPQ